MKNTLFIILLIIASCLATAQNSGKKTRKQLKVEKEAAQIEVTKNLVKSKNFIFKVININPMRGKTINVTSEYEVKIKNDSIFSYLPFFGRAYSVDYGTRNSPMMFELPINEFSSEESKKGFMIKAEVKNKTDVLNYTFQVSKTGSTTLIVNSVNRQSISYYGKLEKIDEPNKKKSSTTTNFQDIFPF